MAEPKRAPQTLVGVMQETGWWPSDLVSLREDEVTGEVEARGQVVVLDTVTPGDRAPFRWEVHSEQTDSTSLSVPFKRYKMKCGRTATPTHCDVFVAAVGDQKSISPLVDCCALVPFDPFNVKLTPKGRVELGQQAIVACLQAIGEWPYPHEDDVIAIFMKDSTDGFLKIRLEPGKPVAYDPSEWTKDNEGMYNDAAIKAYQMTNTRAKVVIGLIMSAVKERHPATIDPFKDCCAIFKKPFLPTRVLLRLKGFEVPSDDAIKDLCRAACAVHLSSLGAWPPKDV